MKYRLNFYVPRARGGFRPSSEKLPKILVPRTTGEVSDRVLRKFQRNFGVILCSMRKRGEVLSKFQINFRRTCGEEFLFHTDYYHCIRL